MTQGILLFAHNSRDIDYSLLSTIAGGLAKKNLGMPVSLITDSSTLEWMIKSNIHSTAKQIFDQIILTDKPLTENKRNLYDGVDSKVVPFINANRSSAWDLTPYERTLLIDADYLILSSQLNKFWNVDEDILISKSINDVYSQDRIGYHDRYISDTGIHLLWATTIMFTKNQKTKVFFDLVKSIKNNYRMYGDLYRFNIEQYRNDISFSIAKHIIDGFETNLISSLPPVLTAIDKDRLIDVDNNKLTFLINQNRVDDYFAATFCNVDLHVMNKQSIIRNANKLLGIL